MLVRCYSEDEFGAFWEKWVASCGPSYKRPLEQQMEAMFPHPCDLPWLTVPPGEPGAWYVVSAANNWQTDRAEQRLVSLRLD